MVKKTRPVNGKDTDLSTIGGRLSAERDLRGVKQVDLCLRLRVSKATQIKYEAGQTFPDAQYLAGLDEIFGFDVLYILTGRRSAEPLTDEQQNLLEAYMDAPLPVKRAAFAVLVSPYLKEVEDVTIKPGYYRHEIKGEEDVRYEAHRRAEIEAGEGKDDKGEG
jgi:transcriptional regulator with XRE-family HTH domain